MSSVFRRFDFTLSDPVNALVNVQGMRAVRVQFAQDKKKPDTITPEPWSLQIDNNAPVVASDLALNLVAVNGAQRVLFRSPAFGAEWSAVLTVTNTAVELEVS